MGRAVERLSTFFVICIVGFFSGLVLTIFGPAIGGAALLTIGIYLTVLSAVVGAIGFFVFYAGHRSATKRTMAAGKTRVAARVYSRWRTRKGKVLPPEDDPLPDDEYHVVLVTEDGRRLELDTPAGVFGECLEGAWGYGEVQGNWLGSYQRDADLYSKYSSREY